MKKEKLKRIAVIGLPGSGKSTFALKLGKLLNIPVHHLDAHCFSGRVRKDQNEFIAIQQELVSQESWIIEGCSITTLEMRFARADTIIYLHFPRLLCAWRVFKRVLTINQDLSNSGCANFVNWALLQYIWNFKKEKSMRIEELKKQYPNLVFYEFRSSQELEKFLKNVMEEE